MDQTCKNRESATGWSRDICEANKLSHLSKVTQWLYKVPSDRYRYVYSMIGRHHSRCRVSVKRSQYSLNCVSENVPSNSQSSFDIGKYIRYNIFDGLQSPKAIQYRECTTRVLMIVLNCIFFTFFHYCHFGCTVHWHRRTNNALGFLLILFYFVDSSSCKMWGIVLCNVVTEHVL